MVNITQATLTAGVGTGGTGTISTLDNLIGTAGTPCAQVQTIQGVTSMTPVKTDGSGVTQPISGTVTASQATASSLNATVVQTTAANLNATVTGTVAATQSGTWNVVVNSAIASGSNVIGGITAAASSFADGALVTLGLKADAKNSATDTTSISIMSVLKQCSFSLQALATYFSGTPNANGPNTSANSAPVVLATDQAAIAQPKAVATGGATPTKLIAAASTNATNLKTTPGTVYGVQCYTVGSSAAYLKLYDKASSPTVGTDTPVAVFLIPVASTAANGAGNNPVFPVMGKRFTNGISFAVTGGITDADTTSVAASTIIVNIDWI